MNKASKKVKKNKATKLAISRAPLAKSYPFKKGNPAIRNTKEGRITVRNTEYLGDITGSVLFDATYFECNPGLPNSFPWLNKIAQGYEMYKFRSLKYSYRPTCATTATGSVMLAADFDVNDYPPESKSQMMSYMGAVRSSCWDSCTLVVPPSCFELMSKERNTRSAFVDATDMRLYDVLCLYIATSGCLATAVGELYVEYEVDLITPNNELVGSFDDSASVQANGGGITLTKPLGLMPIITNANYKLPLLIDGSVSGDNYLQFTKPGKFLLDSVPAGTDINTDFPLLTAWGDSLITVANLGTLVNAAGTLARITQLVTVTKPGYVKVTAPATWSTITGLILRFASYGVV